MPRLKPIEKEEASAEARTYYETDEQRYGEVLNNTKLYAYNLPVLEAMKAVAAGYAKTSELPLSLKSLVRVRIAVVNGCPFCADLHSSIGMGDGLESEKLTGVAAWTSDSELTGRERLALEYADAVTLSDSEVGDELFDRLREEFSEAEIIELTFAIAVENLYSKFHNALQVESHGFCPIPLPEARASTRT
jgi:AhpD family alkylhydroperoxidase